MRVVQLVREPEQCELVVVVVVTAESFGAAVLAMKARKSIVAGDVLQNTDRSAQPTEDSGLEKHAEPIVGLWALLVVEHSHSQSCIEAANLVNGYCVHFEPHSQHLQPYVELSGGSSFSGLSAWHQELAKLTSILRAREDSYAGYRFPMLPASHHLSRKWATSQHQELPYLR